MKQVREHICYYYFILSFAITFIILFPFQWILLQRKSWYPAAHRYRSVWARLMLFIWGITYEIKNGQYLKTTKPVIICSNHSSYLDILTMLAIFPTQTCFMAKAELSDIPLFGLFFKTIDIEVDRQSGEGGAKAYRQAVRAIGNGYHLIIFPEGGMLPDPYIVKPFKNGAFQLAIRQKTNILPVGFPDNFKILPDGGHIAKTGKIRIILHEPLQTSDVSVNEMDVLKEHLSDLLQKDLSL